MAQQEELDYTAIFRQLLESTGDSIYIKDRDSRILLASRVMARNLGFNDPSELVGKDDYVLFGQEFGRRTRMEELRVLEGGEQINGLVERRHLGGTAVNWTLTSKFPLYDQRRNVVGLVGITREINELKEAETALQHLATHDSLTGLPNRYLMLDRLNQTLARAERYSGTFAVLFIDIDDFKQINDTLGHATGDEVLREVAGRLRGCVRASDTVARIAGDEFVVIFDGADRDGAQLTAQKLRQAVSAPMPLGQGSRQLTTSIGVSLFPEHAQDADGLVAMADQQMYLAKKAGKNAHLVAPAA